ncbi:hypothetical protein D046_4265B, partial [Vibrio parahaemolyticus V-223/04]
RLGNCQY